MHELLSHERAWVKLPKIILNKTSYSHTQQHILYDSILIKLRKRQYSSVVSEVRIMVAPGGMVTD